MRWLWSLTLLFLLPLSLGAEDYVSWDITPAVAGPGQPFRLQVHIQSDVILGAAERVVRELKPPRGMALRFSGQLYRNTTEATLNFSGVAPEEEGAYVIPSFNIRFSAKIVKIPEITLNVSNKTGFKRNTQAHAELSLPQRTFYVGERIPGVVHLIGSEQETITGNMGLECEAEGFTFYMNGPPKNLENGMDLRFELTPTRIGTGEIILNGSMFIQNNQASFLNSGRDRPYAFRQRFTVEHVPEDGRPADWTGGIGIFTAESVHVSNSRPEVGEPIKLTAVLAGEGNLERILPPEIVGGDAWEILPANERRRRAEEERMFVYSLIPRLPGKLNTPVIKFSAFNPATKQFTRIEFPTQVVTVTGNAPTKVDIVTIDPAAPTNTPTKVKLSELAMPDVATKTGVKSIVPLAASRSFWATNSLLGVSTVVLLIFSFVSAYLFLHPEIIIFYRARQSLAKSIRQAQQAQQSSNATALSQAIVAGLRAGCAALLKAEAHALTQSDVRRVLPDADASCLDRLFRHADGSKFGGTAEASILADAQTGLNLLTQLKAKL